MYFDISKISDDNYRSLMMKTEQIVSFKAKPYMMSWGEFRALTADLLIIEWL